MSSPDYKSKRGKRLLATVKAIKHRLETVKGWRTMNGHHPLEDTPGKLKKYNLSCNCSICKYYKHLGNRQEGIKFQDKKKRIWVKQ